MQLWVEALLLSADAALALLFYSLYKSKTVASDFVKSAESFNIDGSLAAALESRPDHRVAYACVRGTVQPAEGSHVIYSKYSSDIGVIRRWTLEELKSRLLNGTWSDYSEVVNSGSEEVPFCLSGSSHASVNVEDGGQAIMLDEALTATYDRFVPKQSGVVSTVVDRLAGYVIRGTQERERMLRVGSTLLGFGQLALEHGQVLLRAPSTEGTSGAAFILSTRSSGEVYKTLRKSASLYRKLAIVFGVAGAAWLCVSIGLRVRRRYQAYRQRLEAQRLRTLHSQAAAAAAAGRPSASGAGAAAAAAAVAAAAGSGAGQSVIDEGASQCVVCLMNPRAVVSLDCRHVCMCVSCYETMPHPKRCPVCRQSITDVMPIYIP